MAPAERREAFCPGPMETADPELYGLIQGEASRQRRTINLIASENYAYEGAMAASGSLLTNKYSEGSVGARYYGGTEWVDRVELLCQKRALGLFGLDPEAWGVNVQAYSGSPANFAVYTALVPPGGRIMGMDLPSGGHLTHGYQTRTKKISAASHYFTSQPYAVGDDGLIDYDALEKASAEFLPRILICGYSAYSRDLDYRRLRAIADRSGAYLMADISHISPLVAAGLMNSPFQHCDVVTTTTQKGLRGPRGALVFFRRRVARDGEVLRMDEKINFAVFPMLQGGPHNHTIAGIAFALRHARTQGFAEYAGRVVENARVLCAQLQALGFKVLTGGTDNHMFLVDLKNKGVSGAVVEHMCDLFDVSINKNAVRGDHSALHPSGMRIGTYAVTSRGMGACEMRQIASIISDIVDLCGEIAGAEDIATAEFKKRIASGGWMTGAAAAGIRDRVLGMTGGFPVPGDAAVCCGQAPSA